MIGSKAGRTWTLDSLQVKSGARYEDLQRLKFSQLIKSTFRVEHYLYSTDSADVNIFQSTKNWSFSAGFTGMNLIINFLLKILMLCLKLGKAKY